MMETAPQPTAAGMVSWPAEVAARYAAAGYWDGRSLAEQVYAAADAAPNRVALVDGDLRLTYRELTIRADSAAVGLRELGLRRDDRILVQLTNCWEYVVLTLACLRLGVIPVMALAAHRWKEIADLAGHAEVRALVVPDSLPDFDCQAMAHDVVRQTPTARHVLVVGEDIRGDSVDFRRLCSPVAEPTQTRRELDQLRPDPGAVALMLLSGGTTGVPKLIPRTHDSYGFQIRRMIGVHRFGPGTVNLVILPFGHGWPLASIVATFLAGGRVVIGATPRPEHALSLIEREGVTTTAVVPAIAQRWLDLRTTDSSHDLSTLESMVVGATRLPDHLAAQLVPTLVPILMQGYGMSEGLVCLTRLDDPPEVAIHTQGRPISDADEIMIVDEHDQPVPVGEPGLLLTRGPSTIPGYYRSPEANARSFTAGGWYRTGDVVRQRPDGNLIVEGRERDLINRGGEKVSAEEVENLAYQLPEVRQAAAVAMPDDTLGERVCLYLVLRPGKALTLAEVRARMQALGVARFKLPDRLAVVPELPTTAVGKLDKNALRADIRDRLANSEP